MAVQNYVTPTNKLVVTGEPRRIRNKNLGVATNGYPGRLVVREATDYDVKVSDGVLPPIGFLGYPGEFEGTDLQYYDGGLTTIRVVDSSVPVYSGGGYTIYMPNGLAVGTVATEGDLLLSWADGKVIPGVFMGGKYGIKVPFSQNATVKDTGIDIPGSVIIRDVIVDVGTAVTSGTIDIGFINAGESGDEDGLIDGEDCATAGLRPHNLVDGTAGNITLGALLEEVEITEANGGSAVTAAVATPYVTNGTIKSLVYTTSAHAIAGYFYVMIESPGVVPVGRAGATADASSATCGIFVEATL
ncbi:MAG: hypothetical protein HF308_19855 [Ignavibacteria bacterium]|jgi:hypothetical protein|nr:hypothetical protein [Ignavibacteria bacterium]